MSITTVNRRNHVNALYDSACELLIVARQLERDSARDGIAPGLPPVLGCLHDTLEALARAVHEMSADALMHASGALGDEEFVAVSRSFGELRHDLDAARRRSDSLRSALARGARPVKRTTPQSPLVLSWSDAHRLAGVDQILPPAS